jgi:hypothetical protein
MNEQIIPAALGFSIVVVSREDGSTYLDPITSLELG